jgi:competence protein ComEC
MSPRNNIFSKAPFLKFAIAFGAGIVLSEEFSAPYWLFGVCLLILSLLRIKSQLLNRSNYMQHAYGFVVALSLLLSGILYAQTQRQQLTEMQLPLYPTDYSGVVLEKSPAKNGRFKYLVRLNSYRDSTHQLIPIREKIILYNADSLTNTKTAPGELIHFNSRLFPISSSNNPGAFNYQRYMLHEGIRYQLTLKKGFNILNQQEPTLTIMALKMQGWMLEQFRKSGIEGDEFAVLAALTLGNKNYLSNELKSSFSASGAMHVLAVSGLHVGIIYLILKLLLKPLYRIQRMMMFNMFIIIGALWVYAFITGLSPSVLRSCTMFSFITVGEHMRHRTNFYNILATSVFFLLLVNPNMLYKVGFQLSYAAVASIVFFQPKIITLYQAKNRIIKWLWELTAVSLAAQIGTFPISIFYFHQFPVYFWLSNFVAIPAAGILLYLAFFFFLTLPIGILTPITGWLTGLVVKGLNNAVIFIESLPFSVITGLTSNGSSLVIMIMIVFSLGWLTMSKRFIPLISLLILCLVFSVYSAYLSIRVSRQNVVVFYDTFNNPVISLIEGRKHYYFYSGDSLPERTNYLLQGASTYFRTTEAQPIDELKQGSIRKYNDCIFFKTLTIQIIQKADTSRLMKDVTGWNPRSSEIFFHQTPMLTCKIFENGKTKPFQLTKGQLSYKTMNSSALILFFPSKKSNRLHQIKKTNGIF